MNPFEEFGQESTGPKAMKPRDKDNPFASFQPTKVDLRTPDGLYALAQQAGLQEQADTMIRRSGGEQMKFGSGGFIMDVMDVLNAGSYGVVGLVKGKGFIEGVKNRETLADDDALGKFGWQGKIAGFIGDIFLDPLTYVAPVKIVSKIPGVSKGVAAVGEKMFGRLEVIETGAKVVDKLEEPVEEVTKETVERTAGNTLLAETETITIPGQKTFKREGGWGPLTFLAGKFVYGFAADPKYLNGVQKIAGRNAAIIGSAETLFQSLSKLKPGVFEQTVKQGADGRMISAPLEEVEVLMRRQGLDKEFESVREMYQIRDSLMDKLEEFGVLTKETKAEHWQTYLKQSYDEYLTAKKQFMGTKSGVTIDSKKRKEGLTEEMMKELGQVEDPHVLWATTLIKQVDLLKKAELQKFTADGYAMTPDMLEEFGMKGGRMQDLHQFPNDSRRYGALAGKYVSKEIWNVLKGSFEPTKELGENLVLKFKHLKVVWNPASHVRNAFGAAIQNWWKMGLGPWRLDTYYDATKELKGGKYLDEMRELGFNERSGYLAELMDNYLLNKNVMEKALSQYSSGAIAKPIKRLDRIMMNSYGHTDNVAKMAAYKNLRQKGVGKEEAYAQAMAATFNYSEVTPFVHQMRRAIWGVPFITFAVKAVPLTASTLANNPNRISVFGKLRNSLFQAAGVEAEQEAEALPEYMRDSMFVMRLPWKDAEGRSMYFDLSYIIPFGAIAGGQFLENPIAMNPITQLIRELSTNETFSGNKIFRESDDVEKVTMDITLHIAKLGMLPTGVDFLSDGYGRDGQKVESRIGWERAAGINTDDLGAGERTYYQNAMRLVGMGATPYELNSRESALAYTQNENLTKLLVENGVLKQFQNAYLPKESEVGKQLSDNLYSR